MMLKAYNIANIVGRLLFILLFVYLLVIIKVSLWKFELEERKSHYCCSLSLVFENLAINYFKENITLPRDNHKNT